jgi:hypothetical protein
MVCDPEVTMIRTRSVLFSGAFLAALLAQGAAAQTVQMGTDVTAANATDTIIADVRTDIDLLHPANAAGVVDTAKFQWTELGCVGAVKIKFFRRQGDSLIYLTERGPFDSSAFPTTVSLVPPVAVQEGDVIGIARVANCGNPGTLSGTDSEGYVGYTGDVTANVSIAAAQVTSADTLAVYASGTASESVSRVIPAAASTPGNHGSFFKTSVQIFNPSEQPISGRFVYHPAGVSGTASDPSLTFTVGPGQSTSDADVVATLGGSGLGSIDVVLPNESQAPIIVTRVYNDAGAAGTSGFTEDAVNPDAGSSESALLFAGAVGFLVTPADTARFRFNMGVRTLVAGASLTLRVRDVTGAVVHETAKSYPPTYFEQQSSDTFLGYTLQPSDTVEVDVTAGSAIVYGATTDNVTNDPSIQFARVTFAVL